MNGEYMSIGRACQLLGTNFRELDAALRHVEPNLVLDGTRYYTPAVLDRLRQAGRRDQREPQPKRPNAG
jgi:hypothetical protein